MENSARPEVIPLPFPHTQQAPMSLSVTTVSTDSATPTPPTDQHVEDTVWRQRTSRRRWALSVGGLLLSTRCPLQSHSASLVAAPPPVDGGIDGSTAAAIDRLAGKGLKYLLERQQENGAFGIAEYDRQVAVAALAAMAFLATGSTPERGPYRQPLSRCLSYLLQCARPTGLIAEPDCADRLQMYGHGFSTLILADVWGMSQLPQLRERIASAVQLIQSAQGGQGGWRYTPAAPDADISVTACQMMALRAARNAGFYVAPEVVRRARQYIIGCQNPDGGFRYQQIDGPSDFPRSGAALAALHAAGDYTSEHVEKARQYLLGHLSELREAAQTAVAGANAYRQYFYYGHYYAAQALWQADTATWQAWYPEVQSMLGKLQGEDGSWASDFGAIYATAMATIVLQIPNNVLPILQR